MIYGENSLSSSTYNAVVRKTKIVDVFFLINRLIFEDITSSKIQKFLHVFCSYKKLKVASNSVPSGM